MSRPCFRWTSWRRAGPVAAASAVFLRRGDRAVSTRTTGARPLVFDTGIGLFAKRPARPFPPPFLSLPSASFSDPLSTHDRSRDRRRAAPAVDGEPLRGLTNGDDAVLASDTFIGANDGVGAWAQRPRGHAGLWARLMLHFWARELGTQRTDVLPEPIAALHHAWQLTQTATAGWHGTTTVCGAVLSAAEESVETTEHSGTLHVTNLGDGKILLIRPSTGAIVYRSAEQWHWFDCPRQLGTNSPDSPLANAVLDRVPLMPGDVVLAMSDGVMDNLWEHEVLENVLASLRGSISMDGVARQLVAAARNIAQDPFAESPYMERAIDEGLAMEGGKLDDISVVAARCVYKDERDERDEKG